MEFNILGRFDCIWDPHALLVELNTHTITEIIANTDKRSKTETNTNYWHKYKDKDRDKYNDIKSRLAAQSVNRRRQAFPAAAGEVVVAIQTVLAVAGAFGAATVGLVEP